MAHLTEKEEAVLEQIKNDYFVGENCMGDMLAFVSIKDYDPELSFEDAFEIFIEAMKWAEGDQFFRKLGTEDEQEEI